MFDVDAILLLNKANIHFLDKKSKYLFFSIKLCIFVRDFVTKKFLIICR